MTTAQAIEQQVRLTSSERRALRFDFTGYDLGAFTSPTVAVYDLSTSPRTDVTAALMPTNAPVAAPPLVTTSLFLADAATPGRRYRVECLVQHGAGERSELWIDVLVTE